MAASSLHGRLWQQLQRAAGKSATRRRKPTLEALEPRNNPAPVVTSILRSSPTSSLTGASSVDYAVTFDQPVTGVDIGDFKIGGLAGVLAGSPIEVTGSGAVYTATVRGIHGSGDLRLDLVDNDSIEAGGEPLSGAGMGNGSFHGPSYSILQVFPRVVSINRESPAGAITQAADVTFAVKFSAAVTGVDPTDFALANTTFVNAASFQVAGSGSDYTVMVSGITGSGTLGLNLIDDGSIRDLAGNPLSNPNAAVVLQRQRTFATGLGPRSVALSDLNGDGHPDLVIADANIDSISVLLGIGDGGFGPHQTTPTGDGPAGAAVGDVNGDGVPDVVVPNFYDNFLSVLLGVGDGSFGPQQTIATGLSPVALALGDLNGDGKLDVAVANGNDNSVGVLLGMGDGAFAAQQAYAAGVHPFSIALGDLNGDGPLDIVVGNLGENLADHSAGVLLGNGDGTFAPQTTFASGVSPFTIALGDADADDKLDVVIANIAANTASVLLGLGDGAFGEQRAFATGANPRSALLADINGDGKPDLAAADFSADTLSILLGNGDGSFQPRQGFTTDDRPSASAAGDLNGDGKIDLIVTDYIGEVSVFLGKGTGDFAGQAYTVDRVSSLVQSITRASPPEPITNANSVAFSVALSQAVSSLDPVFFAPVATGNVAAASIQVTGSGSTYTVTLGGITGNGTLGLRLVHGSVTSQAYTIDHSAPFVQSIVRSAPAGPTTTASSVTFAVTFSEAVTGVDASDFIRSVTGTAATALAEVSGSGASYSVTVSGITGRGTLGLVLIGDGSIRDVADNSLTAAAPVAAFQDAASFDTGLSPRSPTLADVNGDGRTDLAVANRYGNSVSVLLGNGDGSFQGQQTFDAGAQPFAMTQGDLNGDGKPDLAAVNIYSDTVSVLLGNGDSTFQAPQTFATSVGPISIAQADLNGDGKPDLVVANLGNDSVSVLMGNGDGTFQDQRLFDTDLGPVSVAVGDFNGDFKRDLVTANRFGNTVSVLLANGNGTFQAQRTYGGGLQAYSVALGEVNGDGTTDLVVANRSNNSLSVLLGNGDGAFQAQKTFAAGLEPVSVAVADLNRDGGLDIAVANVAGNAATVLMGNGPLFNGQAIAVGAGPRSVAMGDLNADGRIDVAVANRDGSTVSVLINAITGDFIGETYSIVTATSTTLVANPLATTGGMEVSFTATVSPSPGNLGTVTFFDNGVPIAGGQNIAVSGGVAVFSISTLSVGDHPVTAAYSGAAGFASSASNLQTVTVSGSGAAPSVVSVTVNGGLADFAGIQRSRVINLTVVFDQPVQLDTNAIALALHTGNVSFAGNPLPQGFGVLPTSLSLNTSDNKTWVITFAGNTDTGADGFSSLKDGVYDLTIDAALVHPLGDPTISMTANSTTTFHRLFGDTNAVGTPSGGTPGVDFGAVINTGDNLAFRNAFNNPATYKAYLDFNGDGVINSGDNLQFRNRFNKALIWRV
jgi:hypothetical protein